MVRRRQTDLPQTARTVIHLTEYQPTSVPRVVLSPALGARIWRHYGRQIQVDFPSPKTGDQWQMTPLGWVGIAPVTPTLRLEIAPRVPVRNLFGMLEYAWDLTSVRFLDGLAESESVSDVYERLAVMLARRVLAQVQHGLYGRYEPRAETRAAIRGRMDVAAMARRPWQAQPRCEYPDFTRDCPENRALLWTLHCILRGGICTARTVGVVRRAYRALSPAVTLTPFTVSDVLALDYHRLNDDYRPLHALCRFFLSQTGPGIAGGDAPMIPFLVNMARLFERFVATWLAEHLPPALALRTQERIPLNGGELAFIADGVWYDRATDEARGVFDTKYVTTAEPAADDIAQVVAYAKAKNCRDAVLIYPLALARPVELLVGDIRVRGISFPLGGDLHAAGERVLRALVNGTGICVGDIPNP